MKELTITSTKSDEVLVQLNFYLNGNLNNKWGETVLEFNNEYGKGQIRCIDFDWGVSLMDYDVHFTENVKITFVSSEVKPIEFVFVSEGTITYKSDVDNVSHSFERFQNIIISTKKKAKETYIFPNKVTVKVNFIYVVKNLYAQKKNNNLTYLNKKLLSTFKDIDSNSVYNHFGNFNLKIADQIRQLNTSDNTGIVRTLSIEGQLNLILAMQILEHSNSEEGRNLPETMSKDDIKKIHDLTGYIIDNISEPLTVEILSKRSGLSQKKLQSGFKLLHSKSVNEYVRLMKLEISRDYIKNTTDSISEIVYKIGFRSRSYFSKIFFEHYGILPTDYRKKQTLK
ncbi:helix-turn-helix domain-containing protein [Aquimarina agarilytica]|uniref:helix-turn-helix domain-containing protein n=1 Tax=Aquimarina agarilytica TaxID=1087449 RepID=UPI00028A3DBE|nr:AraC family transcriptional regulator [Aquimarina agarilytica]